MKVRFAARAGAALAAAPLVLAHVAISLVVLSPREGGTVPPDSELVVLAQRTLGGVDSTTFTVRLDGRLVDPASGRPATAAAPQVTIRVGSRAGIPLRGLDPGRHRLEVDYRPDIDEPARSATIDFTVAGTADATSPAPRAALLGAGLVMLLGAALLVRLARARAG